MRAAVEEARKALSSGSLPVGSVVVQGNEVIGRGHRSKADRYLGHGEVNALRAALSSKSFDPGQGLTVYSTLEPCAMCWGTLIHCPVRTVVFALEDPWGGATTVLEGFNVPRHLGRLPNSIAGVCRTDALALFRQFGEKTTEPFWRDCSNPMVRLMQQEADQAG